LAVRPPYLRDVSLAASSAEIVDQDAILRVQAKALVWQEQVEVLTQALQQANAEKAVLAADKGRLEQEVANLRLQLSVIQKAMEAGQLPVSSPLPMPAQPALTQPVSPVHPMVQQVHYLSFVPACSPMDVLAMPQCSSGLQAACSPSIEETCSAWTSS
jgi:hypothetical protein